MGACCTSTPPENRPKSNTQPLPPEKQPFVGDKDRKTDVGKEQRKHHIVASDTDYDTDIEKRNATTSDKARRNRIESVEDRINRENKSYAF